MLVRRDCLLEIEIEIGITIESKLFVPHDVWDLLRRSNRNFNIRPPFPGKARAFDYFLCLGSGEFDL